MTEERFSYEETKHLFDQDQDGAKCQHVWRLQENHINRHQVTRVCVICHASNGFPDSYDFLRGNYTNAENENLRHFLELAEAIALLERCASGYVMEMQEARQEARDWLVKHKEAQHNAKPL